MTHTASRTLHKADCGRVFGRYDATCPRCQELQAGAQPRSGWGSQAREAERQRTAEIAAHFAPGGPHARGECGPVCTTFDW